MVFDRYGQHFYAILVVRYYPANFVAQNATPPPPTPPPHNSTLASLGNTQAHYTATVVLRQEPRSLQYPTEQYNLYAGTEIVLHYTQHDLREGLSRWKSRDPCLS